MQGLRKRYYPPKVIIEKFPAISEKFGWSERTIIQLYKNGLLQGYTRQANSYMVDVNSLLGLIRYVNNVIEDKKIELNQDVKR